MAAHIIIGSMPSASCTYLQHLEVQLPCMYVCLMRNSACPWQGIFYRCTDFLWLPINARELLVASNLRFIPLATCQNSKDINERQHHREISGGVGRTDVAGRERKGKGNITTRRKCFYVPAHQVWIGRWSCSRPDREVDHKTTLHEKESIIHTLFSSMTIISLSKWLPSTT